jgi:hypothetical protein
VNVLVTNVLKGNTKALGLMHLQFPGMGARGGPPNREHVVHHRADELRIQHKSCSDGGTTTPV